jgi:hypothetical protein
MRRAAFCFALIVPSGILVLVVLRPSPVLLAGAGLTGLMALPLIYFFGKGDTVRQPRAIVPSVELENEPGTDTRAAGATS